MQYKGIHRRKEKTGCSGAVLWTKPAGRRRKKSCGGEGDSSYRNRGQAGDTGQVKPYLVFRKEVQEEILSDDILGRKQEILDAELQKAFLVTYQSLSNRS